MNIKSYIQGSIDTKTRILNNKSLLTIVENIADVIANSYKKGNKVLTAGNGGSAADAQHIAGELVSKFLVDRPALSALSLATNSSIMTAISNDYGYEHVFARQVQANGIKGDVFIAFSTSGNSKNILLALEEARKNNLITVGLTGEKICEMDKLCDYIVKVPSKNTPIIQESHIMIGHLICAMVEEKIFSDNKNF